jgi:hypothetical protein
MNRVVILLVLAFSLTGCGTFVQTNSTTFQGQAHFERGTISVLPFDKTQEGSLEFQAVRNHLLKRLSENGYSPVQTESKSTFIAYITYGIDTGKTTMSSVPLFGQTGGGTSFSSGTVSSGTRTGNFSGTTTTMPTYGVVGVLPVSGTEYRRAVNIDIFKNQNGSVVKVYEMRGISTGSCGNINSVLYSVIDGMFKNFPGENGKTKRVNVDWAGKC